MLRFKRGNLRKRHLGGSYRLMLQLQFCILCGLQHLLTSQVLVHTDHAESEVSPGHRLGGAIQWVLVQGDLFPAGNFFELVPDS